VGWNAQRYLLTEALAADLAGNAALATTSTEASVNSGLLEDRLPPGSMVVYSDAP
jgi:hypothetical protein